MNSQELRTLWPELHPRCWEAISSLRCHTSGTALLAWDLQPAGEQGCGEGWGFWATVMQAGPRATQGHPPQMQQTKVSHWVDSHTLGWTPEKTPDPKAWASFPSW